jgi:hypothetical protein
MLKVFTRTTLLGSLGDVIGWLSRNGNTPSAPNPNENGSLEKESFCEGKYWKQEISKERSYLQFAILYNIMMDSLE